MASPYCNESDSEADDSPLADDIPLSKLLKQINEENLQNIATTNQRIDDKDDEVLLSDYLDDSDTDPTFTPGKCELNKCKHEVFAACTVCSILLCYDHFVEDLESCSQHGELKKKAVSTTIKNLNNNNVCNVKNTNKRPPESFEVEGSERQASPKKKKRHNKKNDAKLKRQSGQEYVSIKTGKAVKERTMRKGCVGNECKRTGRKCEDISEEERFKIFEGYYKMADLEKQREFVARHIETIEPKHVNPKGRRQKTHKYFLTSNGKRSHVCKATFLATLGISDKFTRVVLQKITDTGIVEKDRRGGRQSDQQVEKEKANRDKISRHIDRYPRVESHYCRASSMKEYLNPSLSLPKMYAMFLEENKGNENPSFSTYRRVFGEMNLAFHRPKKDQCSLCNSYLKGDEGTKIELKEEYERHTREKLEVRRLKKECKEMAIKDHSLLSGSFDLQQVIYLPISNEDALFYKRRLSNYNLTFYNLADNNCKCFTWHEGQSKRGSSEISTAVYMALKDYDKSGVKKVFLFSDGCPGQNKNTIMPSMMLHMVNFSENIKEISLRFFESFHGQCEGDSAHSAINTAIGNAGDLFVPSQLSPIFTLARRKQPYRVHMLDYNDFLDFKKLSTELKILSIRADDEGSGLPVNWNKVMELRVTKDSPSKIFFKTSHLEETYRSISLKRQVANVQQFQLAKLNKVPNKISKEKYEDLMSLCSGKTPLIRNDEYKSFYARLPHNE